MGKGVPKIVSGCSYSLKPAAVPEGNPSPDKYEILKSIQIGTYLVVEIKYPDCKNYEGKKILVYKETNIKDLVAQKRIDPHFSENPKFRSPVARFEPTPDGWVMAKVFALAMSD